MQNVIQIALTLFYSGVFGQHILHEEGQKCPYPTPQTKSQWNTKLGMLVAVRFWKNDVTFALTSQAVQILCINLIFDCES